MSLSQSTRVQTCMCSTMQNRLVDLHSRKKQKIALFQEVQEKYGKNPQVQQILLSTFQTPHSALSNTEIERKRHKSLNRISNAPKPLPQTNLPEPVQLPSNKIKPRRLREEEAWAEIIKMDTNNYLQQEEEKWLRNQINKKKLKSVLDQQIEVKTQKNLKEIKRNSEYDKEQDQYWKALKMREEDFEKELKKKSVKEREMMNEYLSQVRQKKVLECVRSQEYDEEVVRRVKEEMIREHRQRLAKKEKEKQAYLRVIHENELKVQQKIKELQKEKIQDLQIMKDYTRMLDKQEQDRLDYLKKREIRIQTATSPSSWKVLENLSRKNLSEDIRLHHTMQEQLMRLKQKEESEQEMRVAQAKELKSFYDLQMKEKARKMNEEFIKDKKIMQELKKDSEAFQKYEEYRAQQEKQLKATHAQHLKQQIHERSLY